MAVHGEAAGRPVLEVETPEKTVGGNNNYILAPVRQLKA